MIPNCIINSPLEHYSSIAIYAAIHTEDDKMLNFESFESRFYFGANEQRASEQHTIIILCAVVSLRNLSTTQLLRRCKNT